MTYPMTRRGLLAAAPALLAPSAALSAAPALAAPVDPVLPLYARWKKATDTWCAMGNELGPNEDDTPEMDAMWDQRAAVFARLVETKATTPAGIAALAAALWEEAGPYLLPTAPGYSEQCARPENRLIATIQRSAEGLAAMAGPAG